VRDDGGHLRVVFREPIDGIPGIFNLLQGESLVAVGNVVELRVVRQGLGRLRVNRRVRPRQRTWSLFRLVRGLTLALLLWRSDCRHRKRD